MVLSIQETGEATLNNKTLSGLPENLDLPRYDRRQLTAGIIHIGVGNFHRAHLAWYVHRLMQQGLAHDWGIIGAGVRPQDSLMRERLLKQDCLTSLIELAPQGSQSIEVTGAMLDFLPVDLDNHFAYSGAGRSADPNCLFDDHGRWLLSGCDLKRT